MLALKDIKNYLNITWEDGDTDGRVKGAAARAQSSVRELIGAEGLRFVDLSAEESSESDSSGTEAEQLFLDACRYIYNDAYEDFRRNFSEVIISQRIKYSVLAERKEREERENAERSGIL